MCSLSGPSRHEEARIYVSQVNTLRGISQHPVVDRRWDAALSYRSRKVLVACRAPGPLADGLRHIISVEGYEEVCHVHERFEVFR